MSDQPTTPAVSDANQDAVFFTVWSNAAQYALAILILLAILLLYLHSAGVSDTQSSQLNSNAFLTSRIELNQADVTQLRLLPEIGDALAHRIVHYRAEHGPFEKVEDVSNVNGIGPQKLQQIRPWLYVENESKFVSPSRPVIRAQSATFHQTAKPILSLLNVNSATIEQLQQLPGIGPTLSRRIIEWRQSMPFRRIEDLRQVRGIGAKTLAKIRPYVTVDSNVNP